MAYDGTIRLDTGIDPAGAQKDLSSLGAVVTKGAAAAVAALGAMSVAAIKVGSDFEAAMSQVAATMGTTVDKIPELTAVAKEMGAATQFSATQAAEALNYLALAGYSAEKSIAALPVVLDLAAAGGMDLAYASDLVTDSMSVLGLSTDDLVGFVDEMAKTAQKSNTSVAQLGEAILVAGGQAKLAGMDTVELNTALGILADNGLKGSEGGTALRNALKNLYTPTNQAADALDTLGITTVDAEGNLRSAQTVLQELGFALDGLSEGERIQVMSEIFDTRTIAAGNALLQNSGERWNELAAQISNAEGAAADMARTMNDNLKGDITILGSALEGLGIQIYDHFNAPLREAAQAGTQAVGELARELARPDMKRSLDALASAFSSLITVAGKLVTGAIQLLVSGFGALVDSSNVLIPVMAAVVAGFAAYTVVTSATTAVKGVTAAFQAAQVQLALYMMQQELSVIQTGKEAAALAAKEVIVGVLTGKVTLAAAAQWLWNAAMTANPVGLIVAGVVALVAGITALVLWMNRETEAEKEVAVQTNKLVDAHEQLLSTVEQSSQAFEDVNAGIKTQMGAASTLATRLFSVSAAEKETAAGQARMKMYIDELNRAVPELNLALNEEGQIINSVTGELYNNADAIQGVIDAKKLQLEQQAAEERYIELLKEQIELEEQQAVLLANTQDIRDRINEGEIRESKVKDELAALNEQYEINTQALTDNAAAQGALDVKYDEIIAKQQASVEGLDEQALAMAEYQSQIDAVASAWGQSSERIAEYLERTGHDISDFTDQVSAYAGTTQDLFNQISESAGVSVAEMTANLEYNTQAVEDWSNNLDVLAERGLNEGLLAKLWQAGPEARASVANLVSASDEEIAGLEEAFANGGEAALNAFFREMGAADLASPVGEALSEAAAAAQGNTELESAMEQKGTQAKESLDNSITAANFPESGKNIVDGVVQGIDDNTDSLVESAEKAVDETDKAFSDAADAHSPARRFIPHGENMVLGVVQGVDDTISELEDAARDAIADAYDASDIEVQAMGFWQIGEAMMQGLADGIRNGTGLIIAAAREAARSAYEAARDELDIHSPSRKFKYLAEMSVKGYGDELLTGKEVWSKALSQSMSGALATLDAQRYSVGSGHAASIVNNSSSVSGGDVIFEDGAIQIKVEKMENEADLERLAAKASRKIGEKTAQRRRLKGGLVTT